MIMEREGGGGGGGGGGEEEEEKGESIIGLDGAWLTIGMLP